MNHTQQCPRRGDRLRDDRYRPRAHAVDRGVRRRGRRGERRGPAAGRECRPAGRRGADPAGPVRADRGDDVDAVLVASSEDTHEKFALACLDAGCCAGEKPLATTTEACLRVVEAEAEVARRLVQVGYMRRFDPSYAEMKRALDSGRIGQALFPHCVHCNLEYLPFYDLRAGHRDRGARHRRRPLAVGQEIRPATVQPAALEPGPRGVPGPAVPGAADQGRCLGQRRDLRKRPAATTCAPSWSASPERCR